MIDKVTDAVCFEMVLKQRNEARRRIEKLEAALARIAKYDLQAIAMDALRPGERIRETLNTSSECVNETGES